MILFYVVMIEYLQFFVHNLKEKSLLCANLSFVGCQEKNMYMLDYWSTKFHMLYEIILNSI